MRLVAFISGRPKPQPRVTQNVRFLFRNNVDYWEKVDADNAEKAALGMINKKGNPFKPTRYAYRLQRLQAINAYRDNIKETVERACGGVAPTSDLFFFFLFHSPKSWSRKKYLANLWKPHTYKPDTSNIVKGIEDALYDNDSMVSSVAYYKLYVPHEYDEGILILEDKEIHSHILETAIEAFIKK